MLWRKIRQDRRKGSPGSVDGVVILHRICIITEAKAGESFDQSDSVRDGEMWLESGYVSASPEESQGLGHSDTEKRIPGRVCWKCKGPEAEVNPDLQES